MAHLLIINLVSLYGESNIYLEDEPNIKYNIRGRDDRLSLAIPSNTGKETILIVENKKYGQETNANLLEATTMEKPDVAFYLEYYLRSIDLNIDEIYLGKTSEIAYKSAHFPLYYYSKINDLNSDINVFFTLHDLELTNSQETRIIEYNEFIFKGSVIPQQDIYPLKNGEKSSLDINNAKEGEFDPALQTGQLLLTSDLLESIIKDNYPTLYLALEKQKNDVVYKKIRLELTANQKNSEIPVTEKLYQYGAILQKEDMHSYKLKVDNYTGYMRIQFSTNSKYINFSINEEKGNKVNATYEFDRKVETGKVFVTFKKPNKDFIYLNVFLDENPVNISKSNNYVFKYINSGDIQYFIEYPINNNNAKIDVNISGTSDNIKLNVTFNKIIKKDDVYVVYSLKVVQKSEISKEELNNVIAMSCSQALVKQIINPNGDKISMDIENIGKDKYYIQVIAQIRDGPIIEYVAYEPYYLSDNYIPKENDTNPPSDELPPKNDTNPPSDEKPPKNNKNNNNNKTLIWIIAGVGGGLLLILVVLVIIVVFYHCKSKDLLEQVNKISFAQDDKKDKNENLLLDENELK